MTVYIKKLFLQKHTHFTELCVLQAATTNFSYVAHNGAKLYWSHSCKLLFSTITFLSMGILISRVQNTCNQFLNSKPHLINATLVFLLTMVNSFQPRSLTLNFIILINILPEKEGKQN